MSSTVLSSNSGKVDVSESAIGQYNRLRRFGHYGSQPATKPLIGMDRANTPHAAALATQRAQKQIAVRRPHPQNSTDALRASTLAHVSQSSEPPRLPKQSADAASAALYSSRNSPFPRAEQQRRLSQSASRAALLAASGRAAGRNYQRPAGYDFKGTQSHNNVNIATIGAVEAATNASPDMLRAQDERLAEKSGAAALRAGNRYAPDPDRDIAQVEASARDRAARTLRQYNFRVDRPRSQMPQSQYGARQLQQQQQIAEPSNQGQPTSSTIPQVPQPSYVTPERKRSTVNAVQSATRQSAPTEVADTTVHRSHGAHVPHYEMDPEDEEVLQTATQHSAMRREELLSLASLADRNVKEQLQSIDETRSGRPGRLNPRHFYSNHRKIRDTPERKKTYNGNIDLGGGLIMTQAEVEEIARRNVEPVLRQVNEAADERRAQDDRAIMQKQAEREERERLRQNRTSRLSRANSRSHHDLVDNADSLSSITPPPQPRSEASLNNLRAHQQQQNAEGYVDHVERRNTRSWRNSNVFSRLSFLKHHHSEQSTPRRSNTTAVRPATGIYAAIATTGVAVRDHGYSKQRSSSIPTHTASRDATHQYISAPSNIEPQSIENIQLSENVIQEHWREANEIKKNLLEHEARLEELEGIVQEKERHKKEATAQLANAIHEHRRLKKAYFAARDDAIRAEEVPATVEAEANAHGEIIAETPSSSTPKDQSSYYVVSHLKVRAKEAKALRLEVEQQAQQASAEHSQALKELEQEAARTEQLKKEYFNAKVHAEEADMAVRREELNRRVEQSQRQNNIHSTPPDVTATGFEDDYSTDLESETDNLNEGPAEAATTVAPTSTVPGALDSVVTASNETTEKYLPSSEAVSNDASAKYLAGVAGIASPNVDAGVSSDIPLGRSGSVRRTVPSATRSQEFRQSMFNEEL